jgi:multidrug efflux pump subunit AcrA (membrane-fusion protein)
MHAGVAANASVSPVETLAVPGAIVTVLIDIVEVPAMVTSAELSFVTPLSVAFMKSPTVPAVLPAVKIAEALLPANEPIALFVSVQANAISEVGQLSVHEGAAVKVCAPP